MRKSWAHRLGALLPDAARHELFLPALADLDHDRVHRSISAWRHGLAVIGLYFDCLRLQVQAPRRDLAAMFVRDVRQSFRIFRREPGFAAAAIVMLALGIGANTALFAVVEAALLRPLPFAASDEVVLIKHRDTGTGLTKSDIAIGDFVDLAARQQSFTALAGYYPYQGVLSGDEEPVRVYGALMTPAVFTVLGAQPAMGRFFTAEDVREGAPRVVVVSSELWRTQLGSDPAVLSRSIQVGRDRYAVVGVTAPGFRFPTTTPTDVILPTRVPPAAPANRRSGWMYAVGRLNPGVTIDRAAAEFSALSQQFEREFLTQNQGSQYYTESLRDSLVGDTRRPLIMLLAAVGFVLLIACANVGNLLLARSLGRQQELAMRLGRGASRTRLIAPMLTEARGRSRVGGAAGV
ncbi:MAG TPA: ABC transporter permease, partial [Vicinamibacterales bacterium]|nr:ABC transporter permease [Vicinamibacterales bacterium]